VIIWKIKTCEWWRS